MPSNSVELRPARRLDPTWILLAVILVVAAALRIPALTAAPPGLNQDEAANAWNAWCLLKTGRDQHGVPWPIFYTEALGANRSTLFLYWLLPFQALGGLSVWTTRLAGATAGLLSVILTYRLGARLFSRPVGLVAAGLLTISPWHVVISRSGHEASLTPLLITGALTMLLWAGWPLGGANRPARPWRALAAGLVTGLACYGYPAARILLPLLVLGLALATLPGVRRALRTRAGARAAALLTVGLAVTLGPLVVQHLAHPETLGRRASATWLWEADDSLANRVAQVATRYVRHFGPDFLFVGGDRYEMQGPRGFGVLPLYVVPGLIAGLVVCALRVRRFGAAPVLLAGVLLYPAGDCLFRHVLYDTARGGEAMSLHVLRSAPGLVMLELLAAVGLVALARWLWRRSRGATVGAGVAYGVVVLVLAVRFSAYSFGPHTRQPAVQRDYNVAHLAACDWLRPRFAAADAVFVTADDINLPYIVMLVGLRYDPAAWLAAERETRTYDGWKHFVRVGKLHFLYDRESLAPLAALRRNDRDERVLLIVRPHEAALANPDEVVRDPAGEPTLLLYDVRL